MWRRSPGGGPDGHAGALSASRDFPPTRAAEREIAWVQAFMLAVRQIRGEMNITPARRIPVLLKGARSERLERTPSVTAPTWSAWRASKARPC